VTARNVLSWWRAPLWLLALATGAKSFVDVHVLMDGGQSLRQAHDLTEEVERSIQQLMPNADVTVHPEPQD